MKIGVIADTHIPERASRIPQQVIEDFKSADMVVHAGDLIDLSVLEQLKAACKNVKAVWGNMDPYEVRGHIREKEVFTVCRRKIALIHGWGPLASLPDTLAAVFKGEEPDIIIFGHAHCAFNEKRGNTLYFNPGSPTDKIYCRYNSYGIIEINDRIEAKIVKLES